jgi:hypothetical protein
MFRRFSAAVATSREGHRSRRLDRKASTGDGAGDRRNNLHGNVIEIDTRVESTPGVDERQYGGGQTFYDPAFTHTMMRGLVAATLGQVTVLSLMKVTGILR